MSLALWPLARVWEAAARARVTLYRGGFLSRYRLTKPVISIGNLSAGGTGKTPFVIWLWRELTARGLAASVLTRGYRREDRREPLVFYSSEGSERAGDEVRLLLKGGVHPVGVAAKRELAGVAIEESAAVDLHLLDDGFQRLSLIRALDIVLLDCTRPPWEYDLLPAGRLREPMSALERAGIVVLTRAYDWTQAGELEKQVRRYNKHAMVTRAVTQVTGVGREIGPAFAFAGIGNPKAFYDDLGRANVDLLETLSFWDHHRYTAADRARIVQKAQAVGAQVLVTTEKDAMNLEGEKAAGKDACSTFPMPLIVAGMDLVIEEGEAVVDRVVEAVRA
jgi:tetraacyldisaccharide 4'-kinase